MVTVRREVSPLELFFDLVFVFAVSQLAHQLAEHISRRGLAQTAVLVVAVFGAWAVTSFIATVLDVSRTGTKLLLLVTMGLGLFMNAGIGYAFTDAPWTFVLPMLVLLLGNDLTAAVRAPTPLLRRHYRRAVVWVVVSMPFWLAGAAAGPHDRLRWWAVAAAIDLAGVWLAHPLPGRRLHSEFASFDAEHMLERLRLFVIILLGETVLTMGAVISRVHIDLPTALAAAGGFVVLVCLFGTYFGGAEDLIVEHVARSSDRIRAVRLAMNATYGGVAGLVAVAVGLDYAISDPLGPSTKRLAVLLFGGIALFLLAQAWYFHATVGRGWRQRLLGAAAVAALGIVARWVTPLVCIAALVYALLLLVWWLRVTQRPEDAAKDGVASE